ncbi:hypothetical protein MKZ38_001079 [Zalerion maritima]|uniref:Uncharacterized protein n=1 Tax=Zalerion maritima TaxID=339359 RepID=A0AAD5WRP4_9PEZI|nr:hypothetical protein MKZ38_001079 [Zalerion maritima]
MAPYNSSASSPNSAATSEQAVQASSPETSSSHPRVEEYPASPASPLPQSESEQEGHGEAEVQQPDRRTEAQILEDENPRILWAPSRKNLGRKRKRSAMEKRTRRWVWSGQGQECGRNDVEMTNTGREPENQEVADAGVRESEGGSETGVNVTFGQEQDNRTETNAFSCRTETDATTENAIESGEDVETERDTENGQVEQDNQDTSPVQSETEAATNGEVEPNVSEDASSRDEPPQTPGNRYRQFHDIAPRPVSSIVNSNSNGEPAHQGTARSSEPQRRSPGALIGFTGSNSDVLSPPPGPGSPAPAEPSRGKTVKQMLEELENE